MIISNIDRTDAKIGSAFPFEFKCALLLGTFQIEPSDFLNISLYVQDGVQPPVRLDTVEYDATVETVYITFADSIGVVVGTAALKQVGTTVAYQHAPITSDVGILCGHLSITPKGIGILQNAARKNGGSVQPDTDDFILDPRCLIAMPTGVFRSIGVNGAYFTDKVVLTGGTGSEHTLTVSTTAAGTITLNIVANKAAEHVYGICTLRVESGSTTATYDVTRANIIVQHAKLSNIRVETQTPGDTVQLSGVKDV